MTSLVSWIGIDSRAPSSIYLVSDSRISWGNNLTWDYGRKLFASRNYPEILGYCGDVLFPSQVLGQLIDLIDSDLLFNVEDSSDSKWLKILSIVQQSFESYPDENSRPFRMVYCTRESSGMASVFRMSTLSWKPSEGWIDGQWLGLPEQSGVITTLGSGEKTFRKWYSYWSRTKEKRTSRSVFGAFCDALKSGEDRHSGGAPQLVGVYRKGAAESFGVVYKGERYLLGLPVGAYNDLDNVEWRNSLFERCDWRTMKPLEGAQRHSRPRGLGKA
jgi:hypothetical protein